MRLYLREIFSLYAYGQLQLLLTMIYNGTALDWSHETQDARPRWNMKSAAILKDEHINMSEELEVRVARIESDVEHIKVNTADLRVELRRTNDKIDALG